MQSARNTPNRTNEGPVKSPLSDSAPLPNSPVARNYLNLFKRTPTSRPLSTASESSSRKTSGSDHGGPAPWPLRHRTHHHVRSSVTSPAPLKSTAVTGSPITRSNCRFHKISIPVDDDNDGTKVNFVVPGCALGNQETMEEQGIEDCGPSTPEEEHIMVTNLEHLEPALVNKLIILVGASLFNEGVCGYIEKPNVPKVSRSAPTRNKSLKGSLRRSSTETKPDLHETDEGRALSPRTKAKSRSRSNVRHGDRAYKPPADGSESGGSTQDEPTHKRSRRRMSGAPTSSVKFPTLGPESPQKPADAPGSQSAGAYIPISRRMKRARRPADAQPYKPEPKDQESSTDAESGRSPRKRTRRQNAGTTRRTNSSTPTQDRKQAPGEATDPFKPKHELKRLLSPAAANKPGSQSSVLAVLQDSHLPDAKQKELERHIALGDKPGEVVDEDGEHVNMDNLEPAPAKVAVHVDRSAHNEMSKNESSKGTEENASGTKSTTKKSWHKFLRF
jgi:hypothetical protein